MAVIVANLYQQAAMCTSEKRRAPRWLVQLTLTYLPTILRMQDKVKAVLNQKVGTYCRSSNQGRAGRRKTS